MTQSQIDLITANAMKLRAVGVIHLAIDGVSVTLAPHEVEQAADHVPDPVIEHSDPLMDPDTYPGGKVPTFARNTDEE